MADLPYVDEHSLAVDRDAATAWEATLHVADDVARGRATQLLARRLLGCEQAAPAGPRPLAEGSEVVGFRVAHMDAPRELRLEGRHRFSDYALTFRVDDLGGGCSRVRAETRAAFPGARGRVYRALVIGSRGHVIATRRLLRAIGKRAERFPSRQA